MKQVTERQKITSEDAEDRDIIAMSRLQDEAVVQVFFIRGGKLIGREHYYLTGVQEEEDNHVLGAFIKQMYAGTPYIPRELWTEEAPEDSEAILEWLSKKRGHKVFFRHPKRGSKERLLDLAKRNAKMVLLQDAEKLKRERARTLGAMEEIQELLGMSGLHRVESYDISNINGFETVGSMVVFEDGRAKKNDYRKFRIRSVTGPDDYASMEELLTRRFTHGQREDLDETDAFRLFPDVIFMDGGKGQVNIALEVLDELHLNIPVCGMVKDDYHRTRGLYYNNKEVEFPKNTQAFDMVTRLQDEAHRFAIEYHRSLRSKSQVHSILEDIPGIGPARRKDLMGYFKDISRIREASIEELMQAPSMNRNAAEAVYGFFHKE